MGKIYFLYDYEDYGPKNGFITTDKSKVVELCKEIQARTGDWFDKADGDVYAALAAALEKDEPGTYRLMQGWGGLTLAIFIEGEYWTS